MLIMITYAEQFSNFVPKFRALVAQEMAGMGMSQREISKRLMVTQAAISQYLRNIRGKGSLDMVEWQDEASKLARALAARKMDEEELSSRFLLAFVRLFPSGLPSWLPVAIREELERRGYLQTGKE